MTASLGNFQEGPFGSNLDNTVYPQMISYALRAPTVNDVYPVGTRWQDTSVNPPVQYFTTGAGIWIPFATTASLTPLFASPPPIGSTTRNSGAFTTLAVSGLSTLTGGINTAPSVVAAGASPQTSNNRTGQVTFSGVSIAAGATQTFVINNTAVGAVVLYGMVGATTGAALNIQSVTNVPGTSSTIVIENGTGATTSVANITFTYICLN